MSEVLPKKFRGLLIKEIENWQASGLINSETAASLIALYPDVASKNKLITILLMLGATLIGLGVLLFIGSNWEHLGKVFKVALIGIAVIVSNWLAFRFRFEPGHRPKLGSAMFLLGSLFYGAGIWLISQIFNLDIEPSNGLMLWSIGTAVMAFATKEVSLACLSSVVIAAYNLGELSWFGLLDGHTLVQRPLICLAMFGVSVSLSYFTRSPWSMILTLVGGGLWVAAEAGAFALLSYGICLFVLYLCHRKQWQLFADAFLYTSSIISLSTLFLLTSGSSVREIPKGANALIVQNTLELASIFSLPFVCAKYKEFWPELAGAAMTLLLTGVSMALGNTGAMLLSNLTLVLAALGLIMSGVNRLKSAALVNITLVFVVFDIIARYFDTFFKMFDRSIFFVVGGLMLLIIGSYIEKGRRKLLGSINA
jgi:uncharacterized membrane protein